MGRRNDIGGRGRRGVHAVIWRAGATIGAIVPIAASAADRGATIATSQPTIWYFLGYPFEAAGMIAALFGCLSARSWIGAGQAARKAHRWSLDIPVSGMALGFTAAVVVAYRPEPLGALLYGAGLGILGEGIFKLAERYLERASGGLFTADPPSIPPAPAAAPGSSESVGQLLRDTFPPKGG